MDQQHHGGLAATEELARWAGVRPGTTLLDLGAGLGGPARYWAWRFGCRVVALEPVRARCDDADRLNRAVGLADHVRVVQGGATALPFADGSFAASLSLEALFHVADKRRALAECRRVLVPGGVLAFSDWVATPRLTKADRARLERGCAARALATIDGYRRLLAEVGFERIAAEDLSGSWRAEQRRAHANLRKALAEKRETAEPAALAAFERRARHGEVTLELIDAGRLGGARFRAARAPAG